MKMGKVFETVVRVTIGMTNAESGDAYYGELEGMMGSGRELFFLALMDIMLGDTSGEKDAMMKALRQSNIALHTGETQMKFKESAYLGNYLTVRIGIRSMIGSSAKIICEIVRKNGADDDIGDIIAIGSQMISFTYRDRTRCNEIPEPLKTFASEYLNDALPAVRKMSLRDRQFPGLGVHPTKEVDALAGASA